MNILGNLAKIKCKKTKTYERKNAKNELMHVQGLFRQAVEHFLKLVFVFLGELHTFCFATN